MAREDEKQVEQLKVGAGECSRSPPYSDTNTDTDRWAHWDCHSTMYRVKGWLFTKTKSVVWFLTRKSSLFLVVDILCLDVGYPTYSSVKPHVHIMKFSIDVR